MLSWVEHEKSFIPGGLVLVFASLVWKTEIVVFPEYQIKCPKCFGHISTLYNIFSKICLKNFGLKITG